MVFPLNPQAEEKRIKSIKEWWVKNKNTEVGKKRLKHLNKYPKGKDNLMYGIKGNKHPRWNGGKTKHMGYIYVKSDKNLPKWNGYIKRANLVWFENTGEIIKYPFVIHHINHNKKDDNFKNLLKVTQSQHKKVETKKQLRDSKGRFKKGQ